MESASRKTWGTGFAALAAMGALASPAAASFITFDPDGAAAANAPQTIGGLDWAVGNSLADNLIPIVVGNTFQLYYQGTLAGVINSQGQTVAPTGLNSQFEITAVMGATQVVTSTGSNSFTHGLAPVQSPASFFEIWYDTTPDADNLTGIGFNDGVRIFLGAPDPNKASVGSFASVTGRAAEPLDQFGTNNYPETFSVFGAGGFSDENSVTSQDPSFFITQLASMSFNSSTVTPFKQVDPSGVFAGLPGGAAPAIVPIVGTINGSSGPDIQFQSDANVSFTEVPEPGTAALVAAGWALAMVSRRRRRLP